MQKKQNIVLVGFMGTGKTTVGHFLAEATGMPLVDMDTLIEQRTQKTIPEIFAKEGEASFRNLERELTKELAQKTGQVVSTGGGLVLNPDNIRDFEKTSLVICLLASEETLMSRLKGDSSRPLLAGEKEEKIKQLLQTRRPLYEAISHKIDTNKRSPEEIARQILALYETNLENGA